MIADILPSEWRLVLRIAMDMVKVGGVAALRGKLDAKTIAENIWDVKNWNYYEKGVPYILWKTEQ